MRRFVPVAIAAGMVLHHVAVWAWAAAHHGTPISIQLTHWDSRHYNAIILDGYGGSLFAYLPLYPRTVAALHAFFAGTIAPQWLGALLSFSCLIAFVLLAVRSAPVEDARPALAPHTNWGWFVFLFSPASYVFHSHHGEALFLLLSWGALYLGWERRWLPAAVLAGLCVLTRNQGVWVVIATASLLLLRRSRWRAVAGALSVGGAFWLLLLWSQYLMSEGNPIAHLEAQKHWRHAESFEQVALAFVWGNPWQRLYLDSAVHHVLWFVLGFAVLKLRGPLLPLAGYVWLSLLLLPLQAEFINVYRYGAVLFPAWFVLGDLLGRAPSWAKYPAAVGWIWLNHEVTLNFALQRWAY